MNRIRSIAAQIALSAVFVTSLAGCSLVLNTDEGTGQIDTTRIAYELQAIPIDGMESGAVTEPDTGIMLALNDSPNKGADFSATSTDGEIGPSICNGIINWIEQNLSDSIYQIQSNKPTDATHALSACLLLTTNEKAGLSVYGMRDNALVTIGFGVDQVLIDVSSSYVTVSELDWPGDPDIAWVSQLLGQLSQFNSFAETESFSDRQLKTAIAEAGDLPIAASITWDKAKDDRVHFVQIKTDNPNHPKYCVSIGPWDTKNLGADPGENYVVSFVSDFSISTSFGVAVLGNCPRI